VIVCGIAPKETSSVPWTSCQRMSSEWRLWRDREVGTAPCRVCGGNLDPGVLVTHEFALEEIENALNVWRARMRWWEKCSYDCECASGPRGWGGRYLADRVSGREFCSHEAFILEVDPERVGHALS